MSEQKGGPLAYTDGGCIGNPGPGGWGVHVEYPDGRVIEFGGADYQTTNNRMELRAAIEAVRATLDWPSPTIVSDSQYVLRGITEWIAGWKRQGWMTSTGQPVVNRDLWEELDSLATKKLTWEWAKGHSGVPGNERCDQIATWFANSVQPLQPRGAATRPRAAVGVSDGAAATRSGPQRPSSAKAPPPGTSYISLVDGIPARHTTWYDCEQRVRGVKSARFKKVKGPAEEQAMFAKWGVTADDLFGT